VISNTALKYTTVSIGGENLVETYSENFFRNFLRVLLEGSLDFFSVVW